MLYSHHPLVHLVLVALALLETKSVGRRPADVVLRESLSIGTSRSLLGSARSQTATILNSERSLSSLIALLVARSHLSVAYSLILALLETLVLVNLVVEGSGSDGAVCLENAKLLLIEDLRIGKAMVDRARAEL